MTRKLITLITVFTLVMSMMGVTSYADTADRNVTINDKEVTIKVNETESDMYAVNSEDYAGKKDLYITENAYHSDNVAKGKVTPLERPEGADACLVGVAELSGNYVSVLKVEYERGENGEIVTDENGNPVIKYLKQPWDNRIVTVGMKANGTPVTELDVKKAKRGSWPEMFWLQQGEGEDKEYITTYCVDVAVNTVEGTWYDIANLEDSEYYSDDAARHIRVITANGYWGTADGTGSVDYIVKNIKDDIANGTFEDKVVYPVEGGKEYKITDYIDGLTEGEAMDATQSAIWAYSNFSDCDDMAYLGALTSGSVFPDDASQIRRMAVYNWLMSLEPEASKTPVINEDSFITDIDVEVGKRVKSSTDGNSDAYEVAVNFTLDTELSEKDNLLMTLTYTDENGKQQTITKRLAGENAQDENYEIISCDGDVYSFDGLTMTENEINSMSMDITGEQYLEQDAYFCSPVGGKESSQSMVCLAEGTHDIDINMEMKFSVDVQEMPDDEYLYEDEEGDGTVSEDETVTEEELPDDQYLEEETADDAAQTGDNTPMGALFAVAIASLAAMVALKKRRTVK